MNREQRRKTAKKYTPQFVDREIQKRIRAAEGEQIRRIAKASADYMAAALALSLRDEFGFGRERIARVINSMNAYSAPVVDGDITVDGLERSAEQLTAKADALMPEEDWLI